MGDKEDIEIVLFGIKALEEQMETIDESLTDKLNGVISRVQQVEVRVAKIERMAVQNNGMLTEIHSMLRGNRQHGTSATGTSSSGRATPRPPVAVANTSSGAGAIGGNGMNSSGGIELMPPELEPVMAAFVRPPARMPNLVRDVAYDEENLGTSSTRTTGDRSKPGSGNPPGPRPKIGRPFGSKNKPKTEAAAKSPIAIAPEKRKQGRPIGSKNKPKKTEAEAKSPIAPKKHKPELELELQVQPTGAVAGAVAGDGDVANEPEAEASSLNGLSL